MCIHVCLKAVAVLQGPVSVVHVLPDNGNTSESSVKSSTAAHPLQPVPAPAQVGAMAVVDKPWGQQLEEESGQARGREGQGGGLRWTEPTAS